MSTFSPSVQAYPGVAFSPVGPNLPDQGSIFQDTLATSNIEGTLLMPAPGVALTPYTLPIPSFWTYVTTVGVVNLSTVQILITTRGSSNEDYPNSPTMVLEAGTTTSPGGSIWIYGQRLPVGLQNYSNPASWYLRPVLASTPANVYIYLAGY